MTKLTFKGGLIGHTFPEGWFCYLAGMKRVSTTITITERDGVFYSDVNLLGKLTDTMHDEVKNWSQWIDARGEGYVTGLTLDELQKWLDAIVDDWASQ